jgi:hypothetical protein
MPIDSTKAFLAIVKEAEPVESAFHGREKEV